MSDSIALFDVDCREIDEAGSNLQFRPRVAPLADSLSRLYQWREQHSAPLVFTTCCSGRMLQDGQLADVLFVPLDPGNDAWRRRVAGHRLFYLEKKTCGDPKANFSCEAFSVFRHNPNALRLVGALGAMRWVVFGNGFDFCVRSAAMGLLAAGRSVHLLADVTVASATGYGPSGTAENRRRILAELESMGATVGTLDGFIAENP